MKVKVTFADGTERTVTATGWDRMQAEAAGPKDVAEGRYQTVIMRTAYSAVSRADGQYQPDWKDGFRDWAVLVDQALPDTDEEGDPTGPTTSVG